ncbi:hypothetical protein ACIQMZ_37185 [Streptomyces longwoodensis]|uniref:hypothetical protein n=1 Tax=Streptomyces longwoodensis TaxID=68231 RepID=UPI003812C6A1
MTDPDTYPTPEDYYAPEEYDDDDQEDAQEWREGQCDNCSGGDAAGVTAEGPLGPLYCACKIGQGAEDPNDCTCGPEKR